MRVDIYSKASDFGKDKICRKVTGLSISSLEETADIFFNLCGCELAVFYNNGENVCAYKVAGGKIHYYLPEDMVLSVHKLLNSINDVNSLKNSSVVNLVLSGRDTIYLFVNREYCGEISTALEDKNIIHSLIQYVYNLGFLGLDSLAFYPKRFEEMTRVCILESCVKKGYARIDVNLHGS